MSDLSTLTDDQLLELKKSLEYDFAKFDGIQNARKVALNSCYGAIGSNYFRFYNVDQAEAVTITAQVVIRYVEKILNDLFNSILKTNNVDYVIYIDTDGLYVNMGTLVEKLYHGYTDHEISEKLDELCRKKLEPFIDKGFRVLGQYLNCIEQTMAMKREVIANNGIWTAKKRYALNVLDNEGVVYDNPELKVTGIETKRSSTPELCRDELETALKILLSGTEKELWNHIEIVKKRFYEAPIEDISTPTGVSNVNKFKDPKSFFVRGAPIYSKASINYNYLLKKYKLTNKYETIKDGDKIKYIYLKDPNPTPGNAIAFLNILPHEFGLEEYIDIEAQFHKAFLSPLKLIANVVGWDLERKATLEDFFS